MADDFDPKALGLKEAPTSDNSGFDPKALGLTEADSSDFDPKALGLKEAPTSSGLGAAIRSAAEEAIPTVAGLLGAGVGNVAGRLAGPASVVASPALGLAGAYEGSKLGSEVQDYVLQKILPTGVYDDLKAQMAQDESQHPISSFFGGFVPQVLAFKPSPENVGKAYSLAKDLITNPSDTLNLIKSGEAEVMDKLQNLIGVSAGAGIGGGQAAYQIANNPNPSTGTDFLKAAASFALGGLLNEPTKLGEALSFHNTIGKAVDNAAQESAAQVGPETAKATDETINQNEQEQAQQEPGEIAETEGSPTSGTSGEDLAETQPRVAGGSPDLLEGASFSEPHLSMGGATPGEYDIGRTLDGADIYQTLKTTSGEEPTQEAWQSAYEQANPDLEQSDYDKIYQQSQQASSDFEAGNGQKPMAEVVRQQFEGVPDAGTPSSITNVDTNLARMERNYPEAVATERKTDASLWDSVTRKVSEDPYYLDNLVEDLKNKPRAISDEETAALNYQKINLESQQRENENALAAAHYVGNEAEVVNARVRQAALDDKLQDLYNVSKSVGAEQGRALRARQLNVDRDYSLSSMVARERAANPDGAPLTEEERDMVYQKAKDIQSQEDLVKSLKAESSNPSNVDEANSQLETLRKTDDDLKNAPNPKKTKEQASLQARKTRVRNQIAILEDKIAKNDFTKISKKLPTPADKELLEAQAHLQELKNQFEHGLEKKRLAERSLAEKIKDEFIRWTRAALLSSTKIIPKIAGSVATNAVINPLREAAGAAISKAIPKIGEIAKKAPIEGSGSLQIEVHSLAQGLTEAIKEAPRIFTTGQTSKDLIYGKNNRNHVDLSQVKGVLGNLYHIPDYINNLHALLHAPDKLTGFQRAYEKQEAYYANKGEDITNPILQIRMGQDALRYANWQTFLGDNTLDKWAKTSIASLNRIKNDTGETPLLAKTLSTSLRTALPITKVSTNITQRILEGTYGLASGAYKAYMVKNVESLNPAQANLILRELKTGAVGNALIAIGFLGAANIGGLWAPGDKQKKGAQPYNTFKVGKNIPVIAPNGITNPVLAHNPAEQLISLGATIAKLANEITKNPQGKKELRGYGPAFMAAQLGVISDNPYSEAVKTADQILEGHQDKVAQEAVQSRVPGVLRDIAQAQDTDANGNPIKRKPTDLAEAIESGIPGLRQNVPVQNKR